MESKTRIGAIIIQDGKLLILKGRIHPEFWTPGGKCEEGETDEECLRRELQEEIGARLISMKFFKQYTRKSHYHDYMMHNKIYLVEISGEIKPDKEIETFVWYSRDDFEKKRYLMIPVIEEEVIPDLIKEGIF